MERICQGTEFFHEMWAAIASVGLSIAILYTQVSASIPSTMPTADAPAFKATWPAFFPLAVTAILLFLAAQIGKKVGSSQKQWLAATDKRVKYISSVINNLLPIKWSSYESVLSKRVAELRTEEMKEAKGF